MWFCLVFYAPPAYISEGGNFQSGCDVCGSASQSVSLTVCDSVCDMPRISGTAEARDFKFCVLIER